MKKIKKLVFMNAGYSVLVFKGRIDSNGEEGICAYNPKPVLNKTLVVATTQALTRIVHILGDLLTLRIGMREFGVLGSLIQ